MRAVLYNLELLLHMDKKELIKQIKFLDNEDETFGVNLDDLSLKELQELSDKLFNYTHNRQQAWINAFKNKD